MAIEGDLTRQKCAENGAQLYGPRVSNFLSHRIVKSLINLSGFTVNWNFNVLDMALKTLHFVQGLPRTPLLFFLDISPPDYPKWFCKK